MMRQQSKRVGITCILVRWLYQLLANARVEPQHDLCSEVAEVARSVQ
jgi:hypothetical protein